MEQWGSFYPALSVLLSCRMIAHPGLRASGGAAAGDAALTLGYYISALQADGVV